MNLSGKNLFDRSEMQLYKRMKYEAKLNYIISIKINEYTLNTLKDKGFYGFKNIDSTDIPITIDDNLDDYTVIYNRESGGTYEKFI